MEAAHSSSCRLYKGSWAFGKAAYQQAASVCVVRPWLLAGLELQFQAPRHDSAVLLQVVWGAGTGQLPEVPEGVACRIVTLDQVGDLCCAVLSGWMLLAACSPGPTIALRHVVLALLQIQ